MGIGDRVEGKGRGEWSELGVTRLEVHTSQVRGDAVCNRRLIVQPTRGRWLIECAPPFRPLLPFLGGLALVCRVLHTHTFPLLSYYYPLSTSLSCSFATESVSVWVDLQVRASLVLFEFSP